MNFGAPEWFWGLLVVPLLAFLFLRAEQRRKRRLREFVSPRLLPALAGTVNRFRRALKFLLLLLALSLAIIALAKPRWGYVYDEVKRKGLDLIFAIDTSRSMLSTDVAPDRLQRVKLAAQDLVNELQGDRVGLIAFAGRAFLQAPLTIDYDAAVDAVNDLDTKTIPEGGTNISEAINLAAQTFGKSAIGNRALIIFTDGEELSGDAVKTAKAAADAGVRIFTIGVGTAQGSLIPITGEDGGTAFIKDSKGQVVKSKLDENRLREIAQATGGIYLHLENGPSTMKQLLAQGLSKMQAGEIDARTSRRPIERYHWPLSAALIALVCSIFFRERKRIRARERMMETAAPPRAFAAAALILLTMSAARASTPGLDAYRDEKFKDAYDQFQKTLQEHPGTRAADKIEFDSGAAAYKMKDYGKAMQSFSQALLSPDTALQSKSHYNLGNTLYEQGDAEKNDEKKLSDWNNALQHYDQTLRIDPQNKEAKENAEFVRKKIEELKRKRAEQPTPTPSPTPNQQNNQKQKDQPQPQDQKKQQQQSSQQDKDQQKQGQSQQEQQDQWGKGENQKSEKSQDQSQTKNNSQESGENQDRQEASGESPTPSPSDGKSESSQPSSSPGTGAEKSPTPSERGSENPTPSPGNGQGESENASPTPSAGPQKKPTGEVKGAPGGDANKTAQATESEFNKEGQMSPEQAERLLQSMKDEEARVQLDERKAVRHVYNDW
ncbi:MAG: Ca-activated chloride channel [Verrucomicrobiota bacterium]|jgi:Ca-activated chloride channel family protein